MITGKNYIGNDLQGNGSQTFNTFNPKLNMGNNDVFIEASDKEIDEAAVLAQQAFKKYSKTSGEDRAFFLRTIADEIMALGDMLIDTYMSETGLPKGRAQGERGRTVGQLRMFASLVETDNWREVKNDEAIPDREPAPKPDLRKMLIPIGPIVVFGASNFPLAYSTAGGDTASALASGCSVIVKSHPMHAGTGELVASAIIKAVKKTGMPNGVFSNMNSKGIEVGTKLVQHPKVKGVGFTGSIKGGRALYDLAAKRAEPIPVFAEMGSINPVIITENALNSRGEEIATTYAGSINLGVGQFCTNPGLLLAVKSEALTSFINVLGQRVIAYDAQSMLHPNIKRNYVNNSAMVSSQRGLEVIAEYDQVLEENYAPAKIVSVEGTAFLNNPKLHTEVFGPFSMVVQCDNEAQLVEIIKNLEGQLTGTIIADKEDYSGLTDIIDALQNRVGRIIFNGVPTGVEVCEAMTHGGPYPASTDSRFTAVGPNAIRRWVRPFSYQDFPEELLPDALK